MKARLTLCLLLVLLPLCGCQRGGPAQAAKAWLVAVANRDGDRIADLTCEKARAEMQAVMLLDAGFLGLGKMFGIEKPKVDLSQVRFEVMEKGQWRAPESEAQPARGAKGYQEWAEVHVYGTTRVSFGGFWQEIPGDMTFLMVVEAGKWRICDIW